VRNQQASCQNLTQNSTKIRVEIVNFESLRTPNDKKGMYKPIQ